MEISAKASRAKLSLSTLELRANHFVVPMGGSFHYFPIRVASSSQTGKLLKFEKKPPILIDGLAIVGKKVYEVSVEDIFRGIVRTDKELKQDQKKDEPNGDSKTSNPFTFGETSISEEASEPLGSDSVQSDVKPRAKCASELEISEAADLAWADEIESLLDHVSSQEGGEWEVTSST